MKNLLVCGDSWTFGSEIRNPILPEHIKDWDTHNNPYRIPRIWPTLIASQNDWNVTNISYPAASNDRIVRTFESWIHENYISQNKDTKDLMVIIGWTSPERKDFFYTDPMKKGMPNWTTIWPNQVGFDYVQPGMNDFFKLYVTFLSDQREAFNRYVHQVTSVENLCKVYNIEYLMFQAFYDTGMGVHGSNDTETFKDIINKDYINNDFVKAEIGNEHPGWHYHYGNELTKTMWDSVSEKRFYRKNETPHSFFGWLKEQDDMDKVIHGQHPSEYGHKLWADEINKYIKEELQW